MGVGTVTTTFSASTFPPAFATSTMPYEFAGINGLNWQNQQNELTEFPQWHDGYASQPTFWQSADSAIQRLQQRTANLIEIFGFPWQAVLANSNSQTLGLSDGLQEAIEKAMCDHEKTILSSTNAVTADIGDAVDKFLPPVLAIKLLEYYRALPKALKLLGALIEVPSVSDISRAISGAPFGPEVRRALDIAIFEADHLGFRTYVDSEGYFGFAELGEGNEVILIVPHLDVVPAGDPYKLVIKEDGTMFGRGVQDDKGPAVAVLYAIAHLRGLPLLENRRIRILFSLSEETGNKKGIEIYKQQFGESYIALVPDGDFPASFEQGLIRIKLSGLGNPRSETPEDNNGSSVEILSISTGDNRANQVPAETEVVFASYSFQSLNELKHVVSNRLGRHDQFLNSDVDATGKYLLRMKVMGKAAHASQPWDGENAVQRLAEALEGVEFFDNPPARAIRFIQTAIGYDWSGEKLGIAGGKPDTVGRQTVNIGTLVADSTGVHEFAIDSRVRLDLEVDKVRGILFDVVRNAGFSAEEQRYVPPLVSSTNSPTLLLLKNIYEQTTGEKAEVRITGVRTDAISFAGAQLLSICYGNVPCDIRKTFHEKPELNRIDSFMLGGEVYLRACFELTVDKVAAVAGKIQQEFPSIKEALKELFRLAKQYKLNMQRMRVIEKTL